MRRGRSPRDPAASTTPSRRSRGTRRSSCSRRACRPPASAAPRGAFARDRRRSTPAPCPRSGSAARPWERAEGTPGSPRSAPPAVDGRARAHRPRSERYLRPVWLDWPIELPVMPPVAPMLARPAAMIPRGHLYEPKWDGFRSIVFRDGDEVEIGSRKERPMTRYFPEVVAAVRRSFPPRAVVDGVIAKAADLTYQPDKRVMMKVKHVRTADCVVAGYRVHKSATDAIGSLLLGLYVDEAAPPSQWMHHRGQLASVGVIGAFPMARRRELFAELQSLVVDVADHPWGWAAQLGRAPEGGSRW